MLSYPDFKEKTIICCFAIRDEVFSFRNDNLVVKNSEGKIVLQVSCYKVFSLILVGHVTITSGLFERSKKFGFSISLLNYNLKPYGQWSARTEGNYLLRRKQYLYTDIEIGKRLISNKILQQLDTLKSIRNKNLECLSAIQLLEGYRLDVLQKDQLTSVLGIEGCASRVYFGAFFGAYNWQGRKPRAKNDVLNVLLDIGYTYLFNLVECMLNLYGFDLYIGVLHREFYQRKSLVCDLVEPFRCIIDRQLRRSYNLGQIVEADFIRQKGQVQIKYEMSKKYTSLFLNVLVDNREFIFTYIQKYYRWFIRSGSLDDFPTFENGSIK